MKPSNAINLTYLDFDEAHNIANIYIARQLSYDEAHRKVLHCLQHHTPHQILSLAAVLSTVGTSTCGLPRLHLDECKA